MLYDEREFGFKFEKKARRQGFKRIAGTDEAGRGPLAGPVVAAACIIPPRNKIDGVYDSKQLTPEMRAHLFEQLIADKRIQYGIGVVDCHEIDQINIYQATIRAIWKAVGQLLEAPDCLLVDGMQLKHPTISCVKIIGGDALSYSIAAASILAKVWRDRLMVAYHQQWPQYGFEQHKGYATEQHLAALKEHGPCPIHRLTFGSVKAHKDLQLDLFG